MVFELQDITQLEKKSGDTVITGGPGQIPGDNPFKRFVSFLAGAEVKLGLTVYDFLTSVDFFTAQNGADVQGGLSVDDITVSGDVNLAATTVQYFGPVDTEGTFRIYINAQGRLAIDKYHSGGWVWCGEFGE